MTYKEMAESIGATEYEVRENMQAARKMAYSGLWVVSRFGCGTGHTKKEAVINALTDGRHTGFAIAVPKSGMDSERYNINELTFMYPTNSPDESDSEKLVDARAFYEVAYGKAARIAIIKWED